MNKVKVTDIPEIFCKSVAEGKIELTDSKQTPLEMVVPETKRQYEENTESYLAAQDKKFIG